LACCTTPPAQTLRISYPLVELNYNETIRFNQIPSECSTYQIGDDDAEST